MKSNTQNAKIKDITEKTLVIGIDVGSETHFARAFDWRGYEYSKKPFIDSTSVPIDTVHTILIQSFYIEVLEDYFSQVITSQKTEFPECCQ